MSDAQSAAMPAFSSRVVIVLLAISVIAFGTVMTLIAWSPELADKDRAGTHPYSSSALGYAGIIRLLQETGTPVTVSRTPADLGEQGSDVLLVVTLPRGGLPGDIDARDIAGPALIVLPKWSGRTNPDYPAWQDDTDLIAEGRVADALNTFDADADIWRLRTPAQIDAPWGSFRPDLGDDLQVMRADSLVTMVDLPGGSLLSRLPDRDVWILSDPDLLNTFGVTDLETARMALGLFDWLTEGYTTEIVFDATLHGFERSENLLQMALDIPFLGASVTALAAVGLLGWAAAIRFGTPDREGRAIALGKEALADSTAGLFTMARREAQLAPGYLALTRRSAARAIGAPKHLRDDDLAALFDRLGESARTKTAFTDLAESLRVPAEGRDDLIRKTRQLWRWRKEITHGRD